MPDFFCCSSQTYLFKNKFFTCIFLFLLLYVKVFVFTAYLTPFFTFINYFIFFFQPMQGKKLPKDHRKISIPTPNPSPTRGIYGFALYIVSWILFLVYLFWALVPDYYIQALHLTFFPRFVLLLFTSYVFTFFQQILGCCYSLPFSCSCLPFCFLSIYQLRDTI